MERIIVRLRNHENLFYSGQLVVGSYLFHVSFNTGMHGIWIPQSIEGVGDENMRMVYDGNASLTYNPAPGTLDEIRLQNGTVALAGTRRTEQLMLGPTMNSLVMVGPQEFVAYGSVLPPEFYFHLGYDGFVGLGLPPPAIPGNHADPIWMTMMNQGLLRWSRFSLYLRDVLFGGTDGGCIIFGGIIRRHYHGHHRYFDLVENSYQWMIHMYSVSVAGHLEQYCDKVLIDSGSKYIYGPPHIIYRINRQILNREVPLYGTTFIAVDELPGVLEEWPEVSFTFIGGVVDTTFNIDPHKYVVAEDEGFATAFRPLVLQPGDEPYFVLGRPWLVRYHTVFDFGQRRIGFAQAVQ